jgi:uridine kinase
VLNKYEKKELCPVYTIKKYLERTKKIRKSNKVLISLRTRQKDSTSTLARWLKIVINFPFSIPNTLFFPLKFILF